MGVLCLDASDRHALSDQSDVARPKVQFVDPEQVASVPPHGQQVIRVSRKKLAHVQTHLTVNIKL